MTKKKIIGLVTLSLAGTMALSSFALASDRTTDSLYTKPTTESTTQTERQKTDRPTRGENIFKTKRGLINKDVLKSVLNLDDEQLKTKLAEHENNVYKLLEAHGKVEEYKSAYLKAVREKLDKAVADNKITKEKADDIYAKAQEAIQGFNAETGSLGVNAENQSFDTGEKVGRFTESFSFNFNSDDFQEELGIAKEVFSSLRNDPNLNFSLGLDGSMLADILGISAEELKTRLVENQGNLFRVLEELGKVDEYKAAALQLTSDALDRAILDGRITEENAAAILARAEEVINSFNGNDHSIVMPEPADGGVIRFEEAHRPTPPEQPTTSAPTTTTEPATGESTTTES